MLELDFVSVHGDVGSAEVLETAGVVEMQVAHDDTFHVFDVVPCCCDFVGFGVSRGS